MRLFRAGGSAELRSAASGATKSRLWLRYKKVGSRVVGIDQLERLEGRNKTSDKSKQTINFGKEHWGVHNFTVFKSKSDYHFFGALIANLTFFYCDVMYEVYHPHALSCTFFYISLTIYRRCMKFTSNDENVGFLMCVLEKIESYLLSPKKLEQKELLRT